MQLTLAETHEKIASFFATGGTYQFDNGHVDGERPSPGRAFKLAALEARMAEKLAEDLGKKPDLSDEERETINKRLGIVKETTQDEAWGTLGEAIEHDLSQTADSLYAVGRSAGAFVKETVATLVRGDKDDPDARGLGHALNQGAKAFDKSMDADTVFSRHVDRIRRSGPSAGP